MSGVVDGIADRPGDALTVVVQPPLGALELKIRSRTATVNLSRNMSGCPTL